MVNKLHGRVEKKELYNTREKRSEKIVLIRCGECVCLSGRCVPGSALFIIFRAK